MTVQTIEASTEITSLRPSPFAVIGTDTSTAQDATDVMAQANLLGWNVRLREMETVQHSMSLDGGVVDHAHRLRVPNQFAVIRDNPFTHEEEIVGTVGSDYLVKQNESIISYMQELLDLSGGKVTAAADFYGTGKQVFFTMQLPTSTKIFGGDVINHNLTCFTSHDGSLSLTTVLTDLRVICANMRNQALAGALGSAKNRHTKNMDLRMSRAKHDLGLAAQEIEAFAQKADAMAQKKLDDADFWTIVERIWTPSTNPSKMAQTLAAKRDFELKEILAGPTSANVKGTVWGGYNAVTEYLQHGSKNTDQVNATRSLRAAMLPTSDMAKLMAKTEKLFLATV